MDPAPYCDRQTIAREWSNAPKNFDNLGSAIVALFVTCTLNGYAVILDDAMATQSDTGIQVGWVWFSGFKLGVV